ncbi:MAG: hypothetical protein K2P99_05805 [Burkholderiales bacterium]|nr:hypothetical protein [Burkholderiales bacterium]
MIFLYSIIVYIISPFIPLYLFKRSYKNKNYRFFWKERFGFGLKKFTNKPIIWLHSVSVGETRAMGKMVEIITNKYPIYQILITVMTPTGRLTAETLYPNAIIKYIPYDMPHAVNNFYKIYKPKVGLIMETEIWPNIIYFAKKLDIPILLVNARLSDKSFNSYFDWTPFEDKPRGYY